MGYVDGDFDLETDLIDRRPVPPGENEKKFVTAERMNNIGRAVGDLRSAVNGRIAVVTEEPDGSLSGVKGAIAIDTTTGITWKNRSGGTRWDPIHIPLEWGYQQHDDLVGQFILSNTIGGGGSSNLNTESGRIGLQRLTATASGADAGTVRGGISAVLLGAGRFVFRGTARIPTLSDGTNDLVARIGAGDVLTTFADHTDGVYLENDRATNGNDRWYLCAASNGTRTKTDTGIAAVAGTWHHFEIRVNAAGTEVTCEIDGTAGASSVTTNIPTGSGRVFAPMHAMIAKSAGSSARTFEIDWMSFYQILSTART